MAEMSTGGVQHSLLHPPRIGCAPAESGQSCRCWYFKHQKVTALRGIIVGNTDIEWPTGIGILDGYCLRETQDGLVQGSEPEE